MNANDTNLTITISERLRHLLTRDPFVGDDWPFWEIVEPTDIVELGIVKFPNVYEPGELGLSGETLIRRAEKRVRLLGERYAFALTEENRGLPEEWRDFYFTFPGTIRRDLLGKLRILRLSYVVGGEARGRFRGWGRWTLKQDWLNSDLLTDSHLLVPLRPESAENLATESP